MKLPNQYDIGVKWEYTFEGDITDVHRLEHEVTKGEFMKTTDVLVYIRALKTKHTKELNILKKGKNHV